MDTRVSPRPKQHIIIFLFFTALAAAVYLLALDAPLYLDDYYWITYNKVSNNIESAFLNIPKFRGIALFSFAAGKALHGSDPAGYRAVNILIHAVAAFFCYMILLRFSGGKTIPALLGSLVFLLHPLQTQAVTYVVQRMTSLSALFTLLALYSHIRARCYWTSGPLPDSKGVPWLVFAIVAGFLAVLSKENSALLPAFVALCEWYLSLNDQLSSRLRLKRIILRSLPYLLPGIFITFILYFDSSNTIDPSKSIPDFVTGYNNYGGHAIYERAPDNLRMRYLFTQFKVFWIYIRLLIFPIGQMLDYAYPLSTGLTDATAIISLMSMMLLATLAWVYRHRVAGLSFGLFWILAALSIESSIFPLDSIFEHRMYLPMFGVAAMISWAADQPFAFRCGKTTLAVSVSVLALLAALTMTRNSYWASPLLFWDDNLQKAPHSRRAWDYRTRAYLMAGSCLIAHEVQSSLPKMDRSSMDLILLERCAYAEGRVQDAYYWFKQIDTTGVVSNDIYKIEGKNALENKNYDEAVRWFKKAVKKESRDIEAAYLLARSLEFAGAYADASAAYAKVVSGVFVPREYLPIHTHTRDWYHQQAQKRLEYTWQVLEPVMRELREAVAKNPYNPQAYAALAYSLDRMGRYDESADKYEFMIKTFGARWELSYNIGLIRVKQKKYLEANQYLAKAASLSPDNVRVLNSLGANLQHLKMMDEALSVYKQAIRVDPNYGNTHFNMALLLIKIGRKDEARQVLETIALDFPELRGKAFEVLKFIDQG